MTHAPSNLSPYLIIAAILQIVWGLTPTASKLVIEEIPVELYITLRWSLSSIIFIAYLMVTKTWQPIRKTDIVWISILGLLGYGAASFGTLYGLKIGGVTNFALMAAISPIVSSLFSIWILKERPQKIFFIALPLSVIGLLCIVIGKHHVSTPQIAVISALLILAAYVCDALVFVSSKKYKSKVSGPQYLAIAQSATALLMWVLQGTLFHQTSDTVNLSTRGVLALIFVSVVSCVLCFAILYWLLKHMDGHKLALFDGLHTISAVVLGYMIFNEPLQPLMILGGALVLLAILLSNKKTSVS